jgi:hypothetical protein
VQDGGPVVGPEEINHAAVLQLAVLVRRAVGRVDVTFGPRQVQFIEHPLGAGVASDQCQRPI